MLAFLSTPSCAKRIIGLLVTLLKSSMADRHDWSPVCARASLLHVSLPRDCHLYTHGYQPYFLVHKDYNAIIPVPRWKPAGQALCRYSPPWWLLRCPAWWPVSWRTWAGISLRRRTVFGRCGHPGCRAVNWDTKYYKWFDEKTNVVMGNSDTTELNSVCREENIFNKNVHFSFAIHFRQQHCIIYK